LSAVKAEGDKFRAHAANLNSTLMAELDNTRVYLQDERARAEKLREALVRVLMHQFKSTEAAVEQDVAFAREALAATSTPSTHVPDVSKKAGNVDTGKVKLQTVRHVPGCNRRRQREGGSDGPCLCPSTDATEEKP
jgi:hypothetical protein